MKPEIHPDYTEAVITCACGNSFKVGSTKTEIFTESCSACHPFYTGTKKIMDTAGRVERFTKLMEKSNTKKSAKSEKKASSKKKTRTSKKAS